MDSTNYQQEEFPLPPELLRGVLQQLSQAEILGPCSLVSRSWRAAAASSAAARGIELQPVNSSGCSTLQIYNAVRGRLAGACCWLAKHGRQVTRLYWTSTVPWRVCLPYSQLCQLQHLNLVLTNLDYQPEAASAASTCSSTAAAGVAGCHCRPVCPLAALTRLTSLVVSCSTLCCGGLCCLSSLKAVQQLKVSHVTPENLGAALPGLVQLTQLTSVQLHVGRTTEDGTLLQLSSLQHLQELSLESSPAFSYSQLPSSLTRLAVVFYEDDEAHDRLVMSSSSTPGISSLTALQDLGLGGVREVDPLLLARMRQLKSVELVVAQFSVQQLAALLAVLPRLQQLQWLWVERRGSPLGDELFPPEASSAAVDWQQLPAACCLPHLSALAFKNMRWPAGVAQHIFGVGWQFPALSQLILAYDGCDSISAFPEAAAAPLCAVGLARLASCCPALRRLDVSGAVQPGSDLSCMAQLKSLACLRTAGEAVSDSTGPELAQLTQLGWLQISHAPGFSDAGLLHLTRLTGLRELDVTHAGISRELGACGDGRLHLHSENAPDVWQQLQRACSASSVCRELLLLEMRDMKLAEQTAGGLQHLHVLLQEQATALQQKVDDLQQQCAFTCT